MKSKKVLKLLLLILSLIVIFAVILFNYEKKRKKEEMVQQRLLAIDYREQNGALPRVVGYPVNKECYAGYDAINEAQLYVYLTAYNEWIQENDEEEQELTIEDIKDYLAEEYNEDGSYRIQEGYGHIRDYVDWYWGYGGEEYIIKYWRNLEILLGDYCEQNPGIIDIDTRGLNINQLQELINKKNNPFYEINTEVMKGKG